MLELHCDYVAIRGADPDRQDAPVVALLEQDHPPESELGISSVSIRERFHFLVYRGARYDIEYDYFNHGQPLFAGMFRRYRKASYERLLEPRTRVMETGFQRTDRRGRENRDFRERQSTQVVKGYCLPLIIGKLSD